MRIISPWSAYSYKNSNLHQIDKGMILFMISQRTDATGEAGDTQVHISALQAAVSFTRQRLGAAVTEDLHVQQITVSGYKHLHFL